MSTDRHTNDKRSTDRQTTTLPDTGYVFRDGPGDTGHCLGWVVRFPDGGVTVRCNDTVRRDAPGVGGVAHFPDLLHALAEFEKTFSTDDVWFDWESE